MKHSKFIGLSVTTVGLVYYAANFERLVGGVREVSKIVSSLPSDPSWTTRFCLMIGDPWLAILPLLVLMIPFFVVLRSDNPRWITWVPVVATAVVVVYFLCATHGLTHPVNQLHETLGRTPVR